MLLYILIYFINYSMKMRSHNFKALLITYLTLISQIW